MGEHDRLRARGRPSALDEDLARARRFAATCAVASALTSWFVIAALVPLFRELPPEPLVVYSCRPPVRPLEWRALLAASDLARHHGLLLVLGAGAAAWRLRHRLTDHRERHDIDAALLRLPLVGGLVRARASARVLRALSRALTSGAAPEAALRSSASQAGNLAVEASVLRSCRATGAPGQLLDRLLASGIVPSRAAGMLLPSEGEEGLVARLDAVAGLLDVEVRERLAQAMAYRHVVAMLTIGAPGGLFAAWVWFLLVERTT